MFANALALVSLALAVSAATVERATTPKTLAAAAKPRYFAAAIGLGHLNNASDTRFKFLAQTQFDGLTPENEMKWSVLFFASALSSDTDFGYDRESIEPFQNVFNFTAAEQIASFAAANDFTMRCHTLVWHSQLAPFVASLSGTALQSAMENHIVMGPRFSLPAWRRVLTRASCSDDAVPQPLLRVGRRERGAQRRRHVPHLAVVQRPRPGLHHHRLHDRAQCQGRRR
jgi:GH35 family endo-1,4-beta-xylanase